MKRFIASVALFLGWASGAWAANPALLTSLRAIDALTNEQARNALPVAVEATVTCFSSREQVLFVQDGDTAIYVQAATNAGLVPGDRILIRGRTQDSFHPIINSNDITILRHGIAPKAVPATFAELIRASRDSMRVTVRARVLAADARMVRGSHMVYLQMLADDGPMDAVVYDDDAHALDHLLDAWVELTGAAAGKFDDKMQMTGVRIYVQSAADVKVLKRAGASPWSLPVTPMDEILYGYRFNSFSQRVRVFGTITYFAPGSAVVLQSGKKSLWINTQSEAPLHIGDIASATGFPDVHDGFTSLTGGEVLDSGVQAPIAPHPVTWQEVARKRSTPDGHHYDLVSIEGKVVMEVREAALDEYLLVSADGHLFSAIYHHPAGIAEGELAPMKQVPVGSVARVTGICMPYTSDPHETLAFEMMLRSFDDIAMVTRPSLLNVRNLMFLAGLLLIGMLGAGVRGWILDRRVRRQTAVLAGRIEAEAALERRRSRILEDINGNRPLGEVLEQIASLVSQNLEAPYCWIQIADGVPAGLCAPAGTNVQMLRQEIRSRSGPLHGTLFVGIDPAGAPRTNASEALSMGAWLATLAIETRGLYSDLVHRSEFDLLTEVPNRFSLEKQVVEMIARARRADGCFGLVYIDLDDFKLVNDRYGHRIGDLYLQQAANRMKHQLRPGDMLGRLGGDEFAALAAQVRTRAGVEEIASRLERCFDEPFLLEGYTLSVSASVGIAFYPEDGDTKDALLSTADSAMYAAKNLRQEIETGVRARG